MPGMLTVEDIETAIREGRIDTVVAAFPDHLGRLVGKRVTGEFFLEHVLTRPMHACAYLLTVDMEMTPLPGFDLTSWDKGYGDFRMIPDFSTLRVADWLEKTALVLCDVEDDGTDDPISVAPRALLKEMVSRAEARGLVPMMGSELEFYLFDDGYRAAREMAYRDLKPSSDYLIDYHVLGTTYDEPLMRSLRNHLNASAIPVEFSKGEWGHGQHELNLVYAPAVEMADRHVLYKNAAKEIAARHGKSISFMAKHSATAAGSSCHLHTSVVSADSGENLFWDSPSEEPTELFRFFLGGLLRAEREMCLLFAPTINSYKRFQAASFAPTAVAWAVDNRTCCLRNIGHGKSFRVENRLPGADVNPYYAMAATIAAGLWGIENKIDCGEPFHGDAYANRNLARVPRSLEEAASLFAQSEIAAWAFGEDIRKFLLHHAEMEIQAYRESVTDWERFRYFERI